MGGSNGEMKIVDPNDGSSQLKKVTITGGTKGSITADN